MYIVEYKSTKSIVHISTHHHFPSPHVVHKKRRSNYKTGTKKTRKRRGVGCSSYNKNTRPLSQCGEKISEETLSFFTTFFN